MDDADAIRKAGWRQGSFVAPGSISGSVALCSKIEPPEDSWFVVVAQDCDLVHQDFAAEPAVELLLCQPAPEDQPAWRFGRDPRRLQFEAIRDEAPPLILNASAGDRAFVERTTLAGLAPEPTITASSATVRLIAAWLSNRYIRPAFPDSFNNCLKPAERKIAAVLKRHTRFIQRIFLRVAPDDELPDDQPYSIDLWLVMTHDDWLDGDKKAGAANALTRLESLFGALPGIELAGSELRPESEITLDDVREMKAWSFDYITHRDEAASAENDDS